jgi:hypothetical protein
MAVRQIFTECLAIQEATAAIKDNLTDHRSKEAILDLVLILLLLHMAHLEVRRNQGILLILLLLLMDHQVRRNNTIHLPDHIGQRVPIVLLVLQLSLITQEDIPNHFNKLQGMPRPQDLQDLQPMTVLAYHPLILLTIIKHHRCHLGETILRRTVLILNRDILLRAPLGQAIIQPRQRLGIPLL